MGTLGSHSGMSSATPSISDLDGYNFRDYHFPPCSFTAVQDDDFGFDPPQKPIAFNEFQVYSPPDDLSSMCQWPDFKREDDVKPSTEKPINLDAFEIERFMPQIIPTTDSAISRFGQMTPPRSDSAASVASKEDKSPKSQPTETRKRTKARAKDTESSLAQPKTTATGRKRKATRKSSAPAEQVESPEDQKRKQSLEKNRLAAAKCRINKKEKTERLQRDSHEKAVENAYLKDQIIRLKDEIQQMNAMLVAHANCEGCTSPEEIQSHLSSLGHDIFNQQLALPGQSFGDFPPMNFSETSMPDNFFPGSGMDQMLHPPLPEFNRTAEFEVHTPMITD